MKKYKGKNTKEKKFHVILFLDQALSVTYRLIALF